MGRPYMDTSVQSRRVTIGSMKTKAHARSAKSPRSGKTRQRLGREVWLDTARQALIEEGTGGVEIKKLATRLRSSRSSFYWFFKDRDQLLRELLTYWREASTVLFEKILTLPGHTGMDKYLAMTELWVDENEYDPKWDGAVRDWARISPEVREVVHLV